LREALIGGWWLPGVLFIPNGADGIAQLNAMCMMNHNVFMADYFTEGVGCFYVLFLGGEQQRKAARATGILI
jgi:hypothetical protein